MAFRSRPLGMFMITALAVALVGLGMIAPRAPVYTASTTLWQIAPRSTDQASGATAMPRSVDEVKKRIESAKSLMAAIQRAELSAGTSDLAVTEDLDSLRQRLRVDIAPEGRDEQRITLCYRDRTLKRAKALCRAMADEYLDQLRRAFDRSDKPTYAEVHQQTEEAKRRLEELQRQMDALVGRYLASIETIRRSSEPAAEAQPHSARRSVEPWFAARYQVPARQPDRSPAGNDRLGQPVSKHPGRPAGSSSQKAISPRPSRFSLDEASRRELDQLPTVKKLEALRYRRGVLLKHLTAGHPEVRRVDELIRETESQLKAGVPTKSSTAIPGLPGPDGASDFPGAGKVQTSPREVPPSTAVGGKKENHDEPLTEPHGGEPGNLAPQTAVERSSLEFAAAFRLHRARIREATAVYTRLATAEAAAWRRELEKKNARAEVVVPATIVAAENLELRPRDVVSVVILAIFLAGLAAWQVRRERRIFVDHDDVARELGLTVLPLGEVGQNAARPQRSRRRFPSSYARRLAVVAIVIAVIGSAYELATQDVLRKQFAQRPVTTMARAIGAIVPR